MDIAIIGGGFTGLTAAYELGKAGHRVTVFEKEKFLGGLAHGFKRPEWDLPRAKSRGWNLEYAYHHLFANDWAILGLMKELGLQSKLMLMRPITANFYQNNIIQLDSPIHLFRFPALSLIDKLRTAALLAFCKINPFWQPLEEITAKDLFQAVGGKNAWRTIWEPLMVGKFGDYADTIAASWLWARIKKRTSSLYYIKGGFQTLVAALEQSIISNGGKIYTGVSVNEIKKQHLKFEIGNLTFDKVLLTVPTPIAYKLFPKLQALPRRQAGLNSKLSSIPHLHAQTLILETKEPILKDVYWLNITDRTFPFLAAVAHTNMIDKKHYGNHHLTYFGNYLPQGHPYLSMTKEQLFKVFLPYIKRLNPLLNSKLQTLNSFLFVGPFAQPVHQLHYSKRAPKLQTLNSKLFLANLDSIYPWDRGTNYAVKLGIRAARTMIQ